MFDAKKMFVIENTYSTEDTTTKTRRPYALNLKQNDPLLYFYAKHEWKGVAHYSEIILTSTHDICNNEIGYTTRRGQGGQFI